MRYVASRPAPLSGSTVAPLTAMMIPELIDRVRAEFMEMPGLELSLAQASRLWNLDVEDCSQILEVLTTAGFLRWTSSQTVIRTGRDLLIAKDLEPVHVPVLVTRH